MILSDGDGTLWEYENEPFKASWDALMGVFSEELKTQWISVRDHYMSEMHKGKDIYSEWFSEQLSMIKGFSLKNVEEYLFPVPYSLGVREFFASVNGRYQRGILSAGISLVVDRAKEELGMDFAVSNILYHEKGFFSGEGELILDLKEKGNLVRKIAEERSVFLEEICFIGDNENDIPALEIVGCPVSFRAKTPTTEKSAKYIINDFRELEGILNKNES